MHNIRFADKVPNSANSSQESAYGGFGTHETSIGALPHHRLFWQLQSRWAVSRMSCQPTKTLDALFVLYVLAQDVGVWLSFGMLYCFKMVHVECECNSYAAVLLFHSWIIHTSAFSLNVLKLNAVATECAEVMLNFSEKIVVFWTKCLQLKL